MFCTACGHENPPNARFCGHCGKAQATLHQAQLQPAPVEDVRALTARLLDLSRQAMQTSPRSLSDPRYSSEGMLRKELMDLVFYFAALDRHISTAEAQVYTRVLDAMGDDTTGAFEFLRNWLSYYLDTQSPIVIDRPLLLDLIEECDNANSTSYAVEARRAFLQVASAVAWADGPPAGVVNSELDRYKTLLQPRSNAKEASSILDAELSDAGKFPPKVAEQPETDPTKLEIVAERFQRFSESLPPTVAEEFQSNLKVDALALTSEFSQAAGYVSDGIAGFFMCMLHESTRVRDALWVPNDLELCRETIRGDWGKRLEPHVPVSIASLLKYDEACGSNYSQPAWILFQDLLNALSEEDAARSDSTTSLRQRYYTLLGYKDVSDAEEWSLGPPN